MFQVFKWQRTAPVRPFYERDTLLESLGGGFIKARIARSYKLLLPNDFTFMGIDSYFQFFESKFYFFGYFTVGQKKKIDTLK